MWSVSFCKQTKLCLDSVTKTRFVSLRLDKPLPHKVLAKAIFAYFKSFMLAMFASCAWYKQNGVPLVKTWLHSATLAGVKNTTGYFEMCSDYFPSLFFGISIFLCFSCPVPLKTLIFPSAQRLLHSLMYFVKQIIKFNLP